MFNIGTAHQLSLAMDRDKDRLAALEKYLAIPDRKRLCPCCGYGLPTCADFEAIPQPIAHRIACLEYRFESQVCDGCHEYFDHDRVNPNQPKATP